MTTAYRNYIILAVVVMGTLLAQNILTGGLKTVRLSDAPQFAGVVAQSMGGKSNKKLPVASKDFELRDIHYFDKGNWVVASVVPVKKNADTAIVVLQKIKSDFQVVLGPGTSFSIDYLQSVPPDVGQYLNENGAIYESGN